MPDLPKKIKNIVPIPYGLTAEQVVEPETIWDLMRDIERRGYYRSNGPVTAEVFPNVASDARLFEPVAEWPSEGDRYDHLATGFGLGRNTGLPYSERSTLSQWDAEIGNIFHPETGLNPKGVSLRDAELVIQLVFGVPGFAHGILSALRDDAPMQFVAAFREAQALLGTLDK